MMLVTGGEILGAGTIGFGALDSVEGCSDIYYGSIADLDSVSVNYVKNDLMDGNAELYYGVESVVAFAASALTPLGYSSTVGNLTLRSGATTVVKLGVSQVVSQQSREVT